MPGVSTMISDYTWKVLASEKERSDFEARTQVTRDENVGEFLEARGPSESHEGEVYPILQPCW